MKNRQKRFNMYFSRVLQASKGMVSENKLYKEAKKKFDKANPVLNRCKIAYPHEPCKRCNGTVLKNLWEGEIVIKGQTMIKVRNCLYLLVAILIVILIIL